MPSTANASDSLVCDTARRIFGDLCDPQTVNGAKSNDWKRALWSALDDSGLTFSWVPEPQGGAGAGLQEGFAVLRIAGSHASPVPIAETMLAAWLLGQGGLAPPSGPMAVAPAHPQDEILLATDGTLSGSARAIAFGRDAQHFAVLAKNDDRTVVALIERDDCRCDHGLSLANEPLDEVQFDGVRPIMVGPLPQDLDHRALLLMGSVARASQIAGTLEYMLARTVAYSQERVAFERKIAKFQAVQQSLARLAGETAAAVAAAESAADALAAGIAWSDPAALLEAGAAKIRSAEAAQVGAAIAHQIHGAIGTTVEYVLHRFSLRALAWRDDFGNESYWAVTLGKMLADRGPDGLWPLIASR